MLYATFEKQYKLFLTRIVRKAELQLEGPEGREGLDFCMVSVPSEDGPQDYLSKAEKDQYISFQYPRRRNSYLRSKLACKMTVARAVDDLTGIIIDHGVIGQPFIHGSDRKITITHCDTMAIARITSKEEQLLLLGHGIQAPTFLTVLWRVKEAMSKVMTEIGETRLLRQLEALMPGGDGIVQDHDRRG